MIHRSRTLQSYNNIYRIRQNKEGDKVRREGIHTLCGAANLGFDV